jgi:hypothetical protein
VEGAPRCAGPTFQRGASASTHKIDRVLPFRIFGMVHPSTTSCSRHNQSNNIVSRATMKCHRDLMLHQSRLDGSSLTLVLWSLALLSISEVESTSAVLGRLYERENAERASSHRSSLFRSQHRQYQEQQRLLPWSRQNTNLHALRGRGPGSRQINNDGSQRSANARLRVARKLNMRTCMQTIRQGSWNIESIWNEIVSDVVVLISISTLSLKTSNRQAFRWWRKWWRRR